MFYLVFFILFLKIPPPTVSQFSTSSEADDEPMIIDDESAPQSIASNVGDPLQLIYTPNNVSHQQGFYNLLSSSHYVCYSFFFFPPFMFLLNESADRCSLYLSSLKLSRNNRKRKNESNRQDFFRFLSTDDDKSIHVSLSNRQRKRFIFEQRMH